MAQSVKLKDGSYIDAGGVYDATQGKTQEAVNAAQNTINSRVGTVIVGTWSAGSATSSTSVQGVDISTIALPAGIWLVLAEWEDSVGYCTLALNSSGSTYPPLMGRHLGSEPKSTMNSFLICKGNQTITLKLGFLSPFGKSYSWPSPNNFYRFQAVCIG